MDIDRMDFHNISSPVMFVWDCGAYVGYYAAFFRKLTGDKGVVHTLKLP